MARISARGSRAAMKVHRRSLLAGAADAEAHVDVVPAGHRHRPGRVSIAGAAPAARPGDEPFAGRQWPVRPPPAWPEQPPTRRSWRRRRPARSQTPGSSARRGPSLLVEFVGWGWWWVVGCGVRCVEGVLTGNGMARGVSPVVICDKAGRSISARAARCGSRTERPILPQPQRNRARARSPPAGLLTARPCPPQRSRARSGTTAPP
jgi:hypothetical protein